jgi:hypothetical protein
MRSKHSKVFTTNNQVTEARIKQVWARMRPDAKRTREEDEDQPHDDYDEPTKKFSVEIIWMDHAIEIPPAPQLAAPAAPAESDDQERYIL